VAPFQRHGSAARGAAYDYRCRLQKRCRSSADSCKFSGIFFLYMVFSVKDHIQHSANSSDTRIDLRFAASFAALSVYAVRKFKQKRSFYVSFVITAFLTALIVFFHVFKHSCSEDNQHGASNFSWGSHAASMVLPSFFSYDFP
jgi:hypothetical protein